MRVAVEQLVVEVKLTTLMVLTFGVSVEPMKLTANLFPGNSSRGICAARIRKYPRLSKSMPAMLSQVLFSAL